LEAELRHAIQAGEFELHYQPKINLHTGLPAGAEALVRWRSPVRGLIAPTDFISFAEVSGLIVPLGEWVIDTACRQALEWCIQEDLSMPLAINISPAQLRASAPADFICASLERYHLAPAALEIELTESAGLATACAIESVHTIAQLGVKLAIDDFGTGYSNLNLLRYLPLSTVKIDRSVTEGVTDRKGAAIISAIVQVAHVLEMKVVAEGVETPEQLLALHAANCDEAQGNLIARPLEPAAFVTWTRTMRRLAFDLAGGRLG
jgi:EAL domain-containing protein (putative c-di-GMP-specific phosphodiesterase class I)